jgi:hypothetical protein
MKDALSRGKEFTDAVMRLDIGSVLEESGRMRAIGRRAAKMSGKVLQLEGDYDSQRLVFAAYDGLYDMIRPSLASEGADMAAEIFNAPTTRDTILDLSRNLESRSFGDVAYRYATRGDFLHVTTDGLEVQPGIVFPREFETKIGGCPYARAADARYFNRFTDRIVETYAEAARRDMPHGWLDVVNRFASRR